MHFVIGSGPGGVAATSALLKRGIPVTMLDIGTELEPERADIVRTLSSREKSAWTPEAIRLHKGPMGASVKGVPKKLAFGSDFVYRQPSEFLELRETGVDIAISGARGGLSNAWGANLYPFAPRDVAGWPLRYEDLARGYRECASYIPLSSPKDRLSKIFPWYDHGTEPIRPSRQAQAFLGDMEERGDELERSGLFFGQSRIAMDPSRSGTGASCSRCGLCLYGCPYDLIYSARHTLDRLRTDPNLTYRPGIYVERIEESGSAVTIHAREVGSGARTTFTAERVFVGCGTLGTARLMLSSLDAIDHELHALDSQYFMVPFLRWRGSGAVHREELTTLAQIGIELIDEAVSAEPVHMLVYTYTDLFRDALRGMLGPLGGMSGPFLGPVLSRLLILQGYLHSNESGTVAVRVSRESEKEILHLDGRPSGQSKEVISRVMWKLLRHTKAFRGAPIVPAMTIDHPGKSYHLGGTFPMRRSPGPFESDSLGRPTPYSRVHLVDASTFPTIPAVNTSFSIFANATRIVDAVSDSATIRGPLAHAGNS